MVYAYPDNNFKFSEQESGYVRAATLKLKCPVCGYIKKVPVYVPKYSMILFNVLSSTTNKSKIGVTSDVFGILKSLTYYGELDEDHLAFDVNDVHCTFPTLDEENEDDLPFGYYELLGFTLSKNTILE